MIKIKNAYLIGLITASLLVVGCGGGSDSDNENNEGIEHVQNGTEEGNTNQPVEPNNGNGGSTETPVTPPTPAPTTAMGKTFTADVMPVLNTKCKRCHGDSGNFMITTPSATYANISDLKAPVAVAGKYLLDKGSNSIGHGGGEQISTTSAEYATIKSWVDAGADFN